MMDMWSADAKSYTRVDPCEMDVETDGLNKKDSCGRGSVRVHMNGLKLCPCRASDIAGLAGMLDCP